MVCEVRRLDPYVTPLLFNATVTYILIMNIYLLNVRCIEKLATDILLMYIATGENWE